VLFGSDNSKQWANVLSGNVGRTHYIFANELRPKFNGSKRIKPLKSIMRWNDRIEMLYHPPVNDDVKSRPQNNSISAFAEEIWVDYSPAAKRLVDEYRIKVDDVMRNPDLDPVSRAVYSRVHETLHQFAAIIRLAEGELSHKIEIDENQAQLAMEITKLYVANVQQQLYENVSETATEAEIKKVLKVVEKVLANPGKYAKNRYQKEVMKDNIVPRSVVAATASRLSAQQLREIQDTLEMRGVIKVGEKTLHPKAKKKTLCWAFTGSSYKLPPQGL
jgi:hypothetical protein